MTVKATFAPPRAGVRTVIGVVYTSAPGTAAPARRDNMPPLAKRASPRECEPQRRTACQLSQDANRPRRASPPPWSTDSEGWPR